MTNSRDIAFETFVERFPVDGKFTIARGSRTEITVVRACIRDGVHEGQAECVPYARYGETPESVIAEIATMAQALRTGMNHGRLATEFPAGAARNALDCALWDLECKASGRPIHELLGSDVPTSKTTAYTISLGTPADMAAQASREAGRPLLKVKLGAGDGRDSERLRAVRSASPHARLIVDANEGWRREELSELFRVCSSMGVELIEQPLPQGNDHHLAEIEHPVPICADESLHTLTDLPRLRACYDAVNIKLDKAGGLTEALAVRALARKLGMQVMVGCMLGTSLAMAPAVIVAQDADYVDLDGPLLLRSDREPPLDYANSRVSPAQRRLWG